MELTQPEIERSFHILKNYIILYSRADTPEMCDMVISLGGMQISTIQYFSLRQSKLWRNEKYWMGGNLTLQIGLEVRKNLVVFLDRVILTLRKKTKKKALIQCCITSSTSCITSSTPTLMHGEGR